MTTAAAGAARRSRRRHGKPGISAGRWLVATANNAVMIESDVRR